MCGGVVCLCVQSLCKSEKGFSAQFAFWAKRLLVFWRKYLADLNKNLLQVDPVYVLYITALEAAPLVVLSAPVTAAFWILTRSSWSSCWTWRSVTVWSLCGVFSLGPLCLCCTAKVCWHLHQQLLVTLCSRFKYPQIERERSILFEITLCLFNFVFSISPSPFTLSKRARPAASSGEAVCSGLGGVNPPQGSDGWSPQQDVHCEKSSDGGPGVWWAQARPITGLCCGGGTFSPRRFRAVSLS